MRVPRSGGMILGMFLALVMVGLLPIVFLAALAQSADAHPRPLRQTLAELGRPVYHKLSQGVDKLSEAINRLR
jgi:hypothetical protein